MTKWMAAMLVAAFATPAAAQQAVPDAPAIAAADDAEPVAPALVPASYALPERDGEGWVTPNRHLSGDEQVWHLRTALNVAALGCGGADAAAMAAGYNAFIATDAAVLAAAQTGIERDDRARDGAGWQAGEDGRMTRLYNFWAQPVAHAAFCAEARAVMAEVQTVAAVDLAGYAAGAVPRLEAPFQQFYAAWDAFRAAHAGWAARHAPAPDPVIVLATAAPVAVGPVQP